MKDFNSVLCVFVLVLLPFDSTLSLQSFCLCVLTDSEICKLRLLAKVQGAFQLAICVSLLGSC